MPELPPDLSDDARGATYAVSSMPRDADGLIFQKPWHAQAFAMTVALHARGLFTWSEWAAALGAEIRAAEAKNPAGNPDLSEAYYRSWVSALEQVLTTKRVTTPYALAGLQQAWRRAAERSAHGTAIDLSAEDFRS